MRKRYKIADTLQQAVGGILLAGPFVVTEEVWTLAGNMSNFNTVVLSGVIMAIGYAALYKADKGRDASKETQLLGVPMRFISLISVSVLSVLVLIYLFSAQQTFGATNMTTLKATAISTIFSVIGAATADSVFPNQRNSSKNDVQKAAW